MESDNVFKKISGYWSDQRNNEMYLKDHPHIVRGSKEYFDTIIAARKKYVYYFDKIISHFGADGRGKKLLEVGCGMGTDLLSFANMGYDVVGIDLAHEHIRLAKKCFKLYGASGEIRFGNAEELEFDDDYFDRVFSYGVVHHTSNPQKAIDEIYRVLKPGGKCFLMLYHKYSLNNFAHIILRYPFENPKNSKAVAPDAPFVYRYSKKEVRNLCSKFSSVDIQIEYLFGAGWGRVYDLIPMVLFRSLSKIIGWHMLIFLKK